MKKIIESALAEISASGNMRGIALQDSPAGSVDLSSNDYLGLAERQDLRDSFMECFSAVDSRLTSSASRLLAGKQTSYTRLEQALTDAYGHDRESLLFNSGYHANSGIIPALCSVPGAKITILADKLVHASIIDGVRLSGAPFERFRHNDTTHLQRLISKTVHEGRLPLIVVESVYSMDGDTAPLEEIVELKRNLCPEAVLYVDEAHAVGVLGKAGLGLANDFPEVDIIIGTMGKALASAGAFSISSKTIRTWLVNKCRSLIFSTALPPLMAEWSREMFMHSLEMDTERSKLRELSRYLSKITGAQASHIQPWICGSPAMAVETSARLRERGFKVLPIRTPTVPPGTDRLRFSLSAALTFEDLQPLEKIMNEIRTQNHGKS